MDHIHVHDESLCITPAEARRIIHVSKSKMYEMLRNGEIPYICNGRRYLIVKSLFEEFIKEQALKSARKGCKNG